MAAWSGDLVAVEASVPQDSAQINQGTVKSPPLLGTIKSISGNTLVLASDAGAEMTVDVRDSTKIVRIAPGQKDLKDAQPIALTDLQIGDRILVRGKAGDDNKTFSATSIVAMKKADIAEKQSRERDEWQKNGVGGLVNSVDAAAGVISITSPSLREKKTVLVRVTKDTILRRYAPGSVKFDDAKPAPLAEIRTGDQLRARGTRSADGNELTAEEVVSGSFRNIAGTITAIDPASNTITVHDLIAKASVVVKVSSDSQMKKLAPEMAQRIAMRLKGGASGDQSENSPNSSPQNSGAAAAQPTSSPSSGHGHQAADAQTGSAAGGQAKGGPPDVQRMLSRLPNSS